MLLIFTFSSDLIEDEWIKLKTLIKKIHFEEMKSIFTICKINGNAQKIESLLVLMILNCFYVQAQQVFFDDFEKDLSNWQLNTENRIFIEETNNGNKNSVMVLSPDGNVSALIKNSGTWGPIRIEGEMLFPKKENNYLGFIYNYNNKSREDFGSIYVKGNSSYIRVNPWRDGNVSRLLYEEYKTNLTGNQAIKINVWHKFKMEVLNDICHLYINDMTKPKITFDLFEFESGMVGFQPRITGGNVWLDNIKVTKIDKLSYSGEAIPKINYKPEKLITNWEVLGPFNKPMAVIERSISIEKTKDQTINGQSYLWNNFKTDKRGAVITGKVTEFEGENTVAYFRTFINSDVDKLIKIHFTSTDEITLLVNGRHLGYIYRDGYLRQKNDWNAWYDFWEKEEHSGNIKKIQLQKGINQIIIKVRNGQFASGGFFAHIIAD
jgi:hypothetical protein